MIETGPQLTLLIAGCMVIAMKLFVIFIAYRVIKLGHGLLHSGVKGEFSFSGSGAGLKGELKSVSPGLLFVLLGVFLVFVALTTKFPQETSLAPSDNADSALYLMDQSNQAPPVPPEDRDIENFLGGNHESSR